MIPKNDSLLSEDTHPSRRAFLSGVAAALILNACRKSSDSGAPAAQAAPKAQEAGELLRIGYLPITDATPLLVAHGRGLFDAEGVRAEKPVLLRSWPQVAEAFQARKVDVVHLLMPMAIWLRFGQNFPAKIVAWDHVDGSALTVAPNINKVEDLIGRTVAVPFWYSIHNVILQQLFKKHSITPVLRTDPVAARRETKIVVLPPPDMPPALANGSIAGFIVADPINALAEINKVGKVLRFTGDVWQHHACCVVVMHESLITENPARAQKIVNAIAKAQIYSRENREATATLLSSEGNNYLPQPKAAIARALAHYDFAEYGPTGAITHKDFTKERIDFQPFPFASYTELLVKLLKETKVEGDVEFLQKLDPAAVHASLVDERFARAAIDSSGGLSRFGLEALTRRERLEP